MRTTTVAAAKGGLPVISVRFTCKECGCRDHLVSVTARPKEQNVVEWMTDVVVMAIAARHHLLSPRCKAKTISAIKVPMPPENMEDVWIGMQTDMIPPCDP